MENKQQTEDHIREISKKVFFTQGRFNAKMHEIAKAAGVNRALLHYYFRSREKLFEVVLREAMAESFVKMFTILDEKQPFEEKVERAIHHIIDKFEEYPFIESFIISEINKNPSEALSIPPVMDAKKFSKNFLKEIKGYIRKNKIRFITPEDFLINMMALCAYPSTTKPVIQNVLNLNDRQYRKLLKARKKTITKIVLMK
jgi:TetR/AcrR family transcriptional regulator